jgi:hypothetical protein
MFPEMFWRAKDCACKPVTDSAALNKAGTPAPITAATTLSGASPSDSLTTNFAVGDTIVVDGTTLTFVTTGTAGNSINITDTVGTLLAKIGTITGVAPTINPATGAAGTGFLMIRRHVLETMCQHPAYAALQFFREHSRDALAGSPNRFALFECMIDPNSGTYLSEDFSFCKRWTDIGGEIWADLESRLDHVGPSVIHGDVSSQFAAPARAANAA